VGDVAVPGAGLLALGLGAVAPLPALAGVAAGVGVVAVWATAVLVRTALAIRRAQGAGVACRGAGMLGWAALATGLTAVALPLTAPPARAVLAVCGLGVVVVLCAVGMVMVPGSATSLAGRLRRGFDGLGLGVTLVFVGWLMPPAGALPPTVLAAFLWASAGLSVVTVMTLRTAAHRPAALLCGGGAVATIGGLTTLAALLAYRPPGWATALAAAPVVVGMAVTVAGARRADPASPAETREPDPHLTGYPLLALPAALGALASLHHLVTVGHFDRTSVVLGVCVVIVLVARELLAVGDIRRYARRLAVHEAHFRSLVAGATDLTMVLDDNLVVRWQSPAAARLFGLADADVVGRPFTDLVHPDDAAAVAALLAPAAGDRPASAPPQLVDARLRDGHGVWRDTESTVSDQRAVPEVAALVVHVRDVSERRHLERTLHRLARIDQLTGLANRHELMRAVAGRRELPGHTGALLVIDLHGLADVNDGCGREGGDAVLVEVARRLRALLDDDDVPARLGGDEFAVVAADGPVLAYALATRLVAALTGPYELPGAVVRLHVSIGLAEVAGGDGVDDVLRRADVARRRARQLGHDRVEWYDTDVEQQLARRTELERTLPGAACRGELDLLYQPVLELHDRRPVGVEALLRWRHPTLGTILPAELLPVAETLGIMAEIGDWVLGTACHQLAAWSGGDRGLWLSVNVSPGELAAAGFATRVTGALAAHGLAPERLVVEVTESRVADNVPAVITQLAGLRKLGVRTALDDFGAGQASLVHLRRLPVDVLKLDPSLASVPDDRHGGAQQVVDVAVSLGRRLGLEIVAEGLETEAQVERALRAGCAYGQGFALSRPAPAERVEAFLEEHRAASC
jgi:diguanylate cyclase (GGDEF)-like protein/PAS domain S-box-containing protein